MFNKLECCGKINPIGVSTEDVILQFTLNGNIDIASYKIDIFEIQGNKEILKNIISKSENSFLGCRLAKNSLKIKTQYAWIVCVQDLSGNEYISEKAYFETGIENWQASWITGEDTTKVLEFIKLFNLSSAPKSAKLYICGLGYFNAKLNGQNIDDSFFQPLVTDYIKRNHPENRHLYETTNHLITYYTYDIASLLTMGENQLLVEVSGGYFDNDEKNQQDPDFSFGKQRLIFEIDFDNGQRIISSDENTKVRISNYSSELYSGENVDFCETKKEFGNAKIIETTNYKLTDPKCQSDKISADIFPVNIFEKDYGIIYDFGVNHSGSLEAEIYAEEDTEIKIQFAECLLADGTLNFETSAWHSENPQNGSKKSIYQINKYKLKKGANKIEPKFSWYCYRYSLLYANDKVRVKSIKSQFIHTDIKRTGTFECSEEQLNRLNDMFIQTLRCNMHSGLIMDCPHREKLPYTGDGSVIMKSAYYNLDMRCFYYKWFEDLINAQTVDGLIPNSAPNLGGGGGYAWGNAICMVTKNLFSFTGDKEIARRGYKAILRWLDYYAAKRDEDFIIRSNSHSWMLGDWLAPDIVSSDVYYISTICYLQAVKSAIWISNILGVDNIGLIGMAEKIKEGINKVYFDKEKLIYGNGVQGENMIALYEEVVPLEYVSQMKVNLRKHYSKETDHHLDTGIILTPYLIAYLTENNMSDIAWKIMTQKTYPSYFCLMENDSTFAEHWSKKWPDYFFGDSMSRRIKGGGELSHCHPMLGSVISWLFEKVAGLDLSALWENKIIISPYFTNYLSSARSNKITKYGMVSIEWKTSNKGVSYNIKIPKNLNAICNFKASGKSIISKYCDKIFYPNQSGHFDFVLESGEWSLEEIY